MKRIIAALLLIAMCAGLTACGGSNQKLEQETFELLNSAYSYCHTGMNYILRAWNFSVSHSTDKTKEQFEALWNLFGAHMGMTEDEMVQGMIGGCGMTLADLSKYGADGKTKDPSRGLNTIINGMMFMKAEYSIHTAAYVYAERNKSSDINAKLEKIKENLKQIGDTSKAYTLLKDYYLMVYEMNNWVSAPNGTYVSANNSLKNYENTSEKYKQELDLMIK